MTRNCSEFRSNHQVASDQIRTRDAVVLCGFTAREFADSHIRSVTLQLLPIDFTPTYFAGLPCLATFSTRGHHTGRFLNSQIRGALHEPHRNCRRPPVSQFSVSLVLTLDNFTWTQGSGSWIQGPGSGLRDQAPGSRSRRNCRADRSATGRCESAKVRTLRQRDVSLVRESANSRTVSLRGCETAKS
jgi:hypothetical protein